MARQRAGTTPERNRIADILAALPMFSESGLRGRYVLLELAGLETFKSLLTDDPASVAAPYLVNQLAGHGFLEEAPAYHALGALLVALLDKKEIPPDDRRFLAEMLIKYVLVRDPDYLAQKRQEYKLPEPATPPPGAAPAPPVVPADGPDFIPAFQDAKGLEQVINSEDNFLDIYVLAGAIYCAQAVCLIEFPRDTPCGTGFLIGPDLLLTNRHVLKNADYARGAVLKFDYRIDALGVKQEPRTFTVAEYICASPETDLDYTLVRLSDQPLKHLSGKPPKGPLSPLEMIQQGKHRGYLLAVPEFVPANERVYVIQHPGGRELKVVLTQNYVASDMQATRLHYVADTMGGSSGSPVLNKQWAVVALHHSGKPYPPQPLAETVKKAWKGYFRVNEGIPMKAILADFKARRLDGLLPRP